MYNYDIMLLIFKHLFKTRLYTLVIAVDMKMFLCGSLRLKLVLCGGKVYLWLAEASSPVMNNEGIE
jgi:hypothetical protein